MGESFGDALVVVEVASDDPKPTKQLWLAFAKPNQALTLVLAQVPEGWTGQIISATPSEKQQKLFQEVGLKPGEVRRVTAE